MEEIIPENMRASLALGKSRTTLFCFHKAEEHLPDRCMRQFGLSQPIPQDVPLPKRNDGEADSKNEDSSCEEWLRRWDNIVKDDTAVGESEYMQWYSTITRRFIGRHASSESLFRETVMLPFVFSSFLFLANICMKDRKITFEISVFCLAIRLLV